MCSGTSQPLTALSRNPFSFLVEILLHSSPSGRCIRYRCHHGNTGFRSFHWTLPAPVSGHPGRNALPPSSGVTGSLGFPLSFSKLLPGIQAPRTQTNGNGNPSNHNKTSPSFRNQDRTKSPCYIIANTYMRFLHARLCSKHFPYISSFSPQQSYKTGIIVPSFYR